MSRTIPDLLKGFSSNEQVQVWMSHGDSLARVPDGFKILASTDNCPVAAAGDPVRKLYGVQFHPEVVHTPRGAEILKNFLFDIAGCKGGWTAGSFIDDTTQIIRKQAGDSRVICGLSGGVDSSVGGGSCPQSDRRPADLYLCRSWPAQKERARPGGRGFFRAHAPQPDLRGCLRKVP